MATTETFEDSLIAETHQEAEFEVGQERFLRAPFMPLVRQLSVVSNWHSACSIALQWAVIIAAGWAAIASGHWAVYLLAILVIAGRQQAMGVLVHEGSHFSLFTNHIVNDVICDLFIAFPVGLSTTLYRAHHLRHHRYTNTERDPDWVNQQADRDWEWPKTRWGCFSLLIRSLLGLNLSQATKVYLSFSPFVNLLKPVSPAYPLRARALFLSSSVVVYAVLIWTQAWWPALLLWVLPSLTLLNLFSRVRFTAEHIGVENECELNFTRTVIPSWLERVFIAPFGINYHVEHHVFPSVPGRNLAKLHGALMQDERFRSQAHLSYGYFGLRKGVLGELMRPRPSE